MNHTLKSESSILINSPISSVWETLTDPAKIKLWLFGTDTVTDWKPGSPVIFQGDYNGTSYKDKGVVVDNQEGKLLSYTYWSGFSGLEDIPENYSLVSFMLAANGDSAMLTISQQGFQDENSMNHSQTNWQSVLDLLKDVAEKSK